MIVVGTILVFIVYLNFAMKHRIKKEYRGKEGIFKVKGSKDQFTIKKGEIEFLVKDGEIVGCCDRRVSNEIQYYKGV